MYGKIFESLYRGSMVGSGSAMFAVWTYVIATMRPDKEVGAQVEINPGLLAYTLGEQQSVIEDVVRKLCDPDPNSSTKTEDGRRLVKVGQFCYRVVNGAAYMAIRNEEERREYNRVRKRKSRASGKSKNGTPERGELTDGKNLENPTWRQS